MLRVLPFVSEREECIPSPLDPLLLCFAPPPREKSQLSTSVFPPVFCPLRRDLYPLVPLKIILVTQVVEEPLTSVLFSFPPSLS